MHAKYGVIGALIDGCSVLALFEVYSVACTCQRELVRVSVQVGRGVVSMQVDLQLGCQSERCSASVAADQSERSGVSV